MGFDFVSYAMGKAAGGGGGGTPVINPLSISENGTYSAPSGVDGYSPVSVNVPSRTLEWNEPIIRNWDFTNPINTRGSSEYTGTGGTINGWKQIATTICRLVDGGIKILTNGGNTNMYYQIKITDALLNGKTMTISLMANNKVVYQSFVFDKTQVRQSDVWLDNINFWLNRDTSMVCAVGFYNEGLGDNTIIQAVKLEFGSVSTLCDVVDGVATLRKHQINERDEPYFLYYLAGMS